MSDKSKNSHIERTVYVSPRTTNDSSVRWGDWHDTEGPHRWYDGDYHPNNPLGCYRAFGVPLTIIQSATGSDYSGNLVEASNARTLKREFPWLVEIHGGHGTFGIGYLGKRENQNPALIEAIDALTDYPLVSDDDHSALEMEKVEEAWAEAYGGRRDWKRALVKLFADMSDDEHTYDEDKLDESLVDQLWYDCVEAYRGGEGHLNESGDTICFPIDDVIDSLDRDRKRNHTAIDKPTWGADNRSIREKLRALAEASLVTESADA